MKTFEQIGRTYLPGNSTGGGRVDEMLNTVPVVSAVLGSVAGLPAVQACLCHFNVMVKNTSQVFVAGPKVVEQATGRSISKEELGDERIQVKNGVILNLADSEEDAISIANDTPYGLTNYIQTQDKEKVQRVARKLRSGMVDVNGVGIAVASPFGGYKHSGIGREAGTEGLIEFLEVKTVGGWN